MAPSPGHLAWRISNLERDIEDAFASLIDGPWKRPHAGVTGWPATDLYETDEAYLLLADLPGVVPGDIELHVEGHQVVLYGLRWSTGFVRHDREVFVERTCGRFCRHFCLEMPVDAEGIEHGYENGIYWARLPKRRNKKSNEHE